MSEPATDKISEQLLGLLQCPAGKGSLVQEGDKLVCRSCGLAFPIRDGIAVLLLEEAQLPSGATSLDQIRCLGEPA